MIEVRESVVVQIKELTSIAGSSGVYTISYSGVALDFVRGPVQTFPFGPSVFYVSHDYEYEGGNCIQYLVSTYSNFNHINTDTVNLTYSNVELFRAVPDQIAYWNHATAYEFDLFYLLSLIGYDVLMPNQDLLTSRNNFNYDYSFDLDGRVSQMTVEAGDAAKYYFELSYFND